MSTRLRFLSTYYNTNARTTTQDFRHIDENKNDTYSENNN
jgi:hypothetical protein